MSSLPKWSSSILGWELHQCSKNRGSYNLWILNCKPYFLNCKQSKLETVKRKDWMVHFIVLKMSHTFWKVSSLCQYGDTHISDCIAASIFALYENSWNISSNHFCIYLLEIYIYHKKTKMGLSLFGKVFVH